MDVRLETLKLRIKVEPRSKYAFAFGPNAFRIVTARSCPLDVNTKDPVKVAWPATRPALVSVPSMACAVPSKSQECCVGKLARASIPAVKPAS